MYPRHRSTGRAGLIRGASIAAMTALCLSSAAFAQQAEAPNILLILADDMGYSDLGAFGSEIRTPNLDALANAGMVLTNFHAGPVCNITRLQLMSGIDNNIATDPEGASAATRTALRHDALTIAEALQPAGYRSYMVGKWDLGQREDQSPLARGFERSFAMLPGTASHYNEPSLPQREPVYFDGSGQPVTLDENFYSTRGYTDRLLEFLEADSGGDKPFFAYLSYTAPHFPVQAPDDYIARYEGVYDAGYDALRADRLRRMKLKGIIPKDFADAPIPPEAIGWQAWPSDEERRLESRRMQVYAGMIDYMDEQIGRIIAYLDQSGELDNTLIVFTSDNGATAGWTPPVFVNHGGAGPDNSFANLGRRGSYMTQGTGWSWVSNAPFNRYKDSPWEGGHSVPAIAYLPGTIAAGSKSDAFLNVRDLLPTFLDLAGADLPRQNAAGQPVLALDGRSALGVLAGKDGTGPNAGQSVAFRNGDTGYLFRDNWKMLQTETGWALYDLSLDRAEQHDLAASQPGVLQELARDWDRNEDRITAAMPQ